MPDQLPHIFERFYRADSSRNAAQSGAGLGLSIAHALMEAQQGTIAITSDDGRGTQVVLTLPASSVPDQP